MKDAVLFMAVRDLIQNNSEAKEEVLKLLKSYTPPAPYVYAEAQKEYLSYFK